jgi:hypothetical protein
MFELTETQIEGFAGYKASYLPERIRTSPAFLPAIREHLGSLIQLAEPEICARRGEFFKLDVTTDEFRERVLLADGAKVVIGGIRFRNLDPTFPFVEVNASFDLFRPKLLEHVASVARQQFGGFAPKGILAVGPPDVALLPRVERWSHTVCGSSTIASNAQLPAELACSFPSRVDFYNEYRTAYAAWQATSPALGGVVRIETKADLEASAAEGLLASFSDAAGWCGVVAAREEVLYGAHALYIFEIFLAERWRGKGVATAIDAALVSSVARRYSLVWENIHCENCPSLRVALAQGRSVLDSEYFFRFGGDGRS